MSSSPENPGNDIRHIISLGSCISGIPITLHYTFFLLLALEFVNAVIRYSSSYPMYILFVALLYGPILLVTILVHEFGHALTTKKMGGTVGGIVLWPLGGFTLCGPTESVGSDLKVSLAGPATHIPMGVFWWIIYVITCGQQSGLWPARTIYVDVLSNSAAGFFEILSAQAMYLNLYLLCFNLFLPAYPLDGGRVYAACLILVLKLKAKMAAKVTAITAMLIATGMVIYAVIGFFSPVASSSLLLGLIGIFVLFQSYELWIQVKNDNLDHHPIFGRECYKETTDTTGGNEVPATSDEAELA